MKEKWLRLLFRRRVIVILLLLIQAGLLFYMVWDTTRRYTVLTVLLSALSVVVIMYIINLPDKPAYKFTWVILIAALPVFGGLFYLVFKLQSSAHIFKKGAAFYEKKSREAMRWDTGVRDAFALEAPEHITQVDYLMKTAGFPVYSSTRAEYLSPGEKQFEKMLDEIKKAERYIFLEFFIIEDGVMWNALLGVLTEKAALGVDVRVIYDDVGCFLKLPVDYERELIRRGIKCMVFNPFHPIWSTVQNNRDHRKIAVIDGRVAFTGGSNIADEYINRIERFGHWKDAGVMLAGDAAWSFTVMFLSMWDAIGGTDEDYGKFLPDNTKELPEDEKKALPDNKKTSPESVIALPKSAQALPDGVKVPGCYVQPYSDSPLDRENVGEHVYLQMINNARRYLYITTPYLIVDDNMLSALMLAAKSGVDVRIMTPHMPDKRFVHTTTRSYYASLIKAGVRVYEYTPCFLHSKMFISDDMTAVIGTANLDFRSLYLHFECGAWIYNSPAVTAARDDFMETLLICREIMADDEICNSNFIVRVIRFILRLCAPLM